MAILDRFEYEYEYEHEHGAREELRTKHWTELLDREFFCVASTPRNRSMHSFNAFFRQGESFT
ncbi:MAG: hypothetical protein DWH99_15755 [Planctomycetota bacterium]|nr:MAG: hypothetical protein DWH99_15755 [Planctomycetota bacterium]